MTKTSTPQVRRSSISTLVVSALVLFVAGHATVSAQGPTTATILGTVMDTSGAVVPGATVEVTNVGTGAVQTAVTNAQGRYTVADLQIGDYSVQTSLEGFRTVLRTGITLTVGSRAVIDAVLSVGGTSEVVTVQAQVTQVDTGTAALGALTDQRQMRELPLNGRNFQQLILLAPGVQDVNTVSPNARQGRETSFSVAGARPEGQAIMLDGERLENLYRRGIGTVTGASLGVEAIAEFQTLTNTYSAQFGGNGVAVNMVSKAGTNDLHGSAYHFLRDSALDAKNYFDAAKPDFTRNQYGGSLGGPIRTDKMFFFANFEGIRQTLGQTRIATVPAPTSRTPTFARETNPQMYDAIAGVLALYPQPTTLIGNGSVGQLRTVANQIAREDFYFGRFDFNASDKDSFFARYMYDKQYLNDPFTGGGGQLPYWGEIDENRNHFLTSTWRHLFSSAVLNTARFSFSRPNTIVRHASALTPALQILPGRSDASMGISGVATVGPSTFVPAAQAQNRFTAADDFLLTTSSHSLRVGLSVTRQLSDIYYAFRSGSAWNFQSLANFRAGIAQTVTGTPVGSQYNPYRYFRETQITPYVQDDWRVSERLTLNLGLRYEYVTNPTEKDNNFFTVTDFEHGTGFVRVEHPNEKNPNTKNFDPRVGVAWDVFGDHRTAVRGGWGITHSPVFPGNYISFFTSAPPWDAFQQLRPSFPVPFTGANAALPSATIGWNYYTDRAPYLMQYNVNVQRELTVGTVVTVGYVGSQGRNLLTLREMNPFTAAIDANGVYHFSTSRMNPNLANIPMQVASTESSYNSLQVSLNRAFSNNIQSQVNYTWSACTDTGGSPVGSLNGGNSPSAWSNPYDQSVDEGPCYYNTDHALRVNALFALPFRGNRFVEGWHITGIVAANTGLPFTISTGFDRAFTGGGGRPNLVPGCDVHVGRVDQWFNPNCFELQEAGTLGNTPRNSVRGPGQFTVDMAVLKDTALTGGSRLQFRWEIFNLLNRANFALPAANIFTASGRNPTAGQITRTSTTARQMQLGLKFLF